MGLQLIIFVVVEAVSQQTKNYYAQVLYMDAILILELFLSQSLNKNLKSSFHEATEIFFFVLFN